MKTEILLPLIIINSLLILLVLKIKFRRITKIFILIQMVVLTMFNILFLVLSNLKDVYDETGNLLFLNPFWILHFPLSLAVIPMYMASGSLAFYFILFFETGLPGIFLYWFYVETYYKLKERFLNIKITD